MTPEQLDDIRHDRASMGSERTIAALLAEVDRLTKALAVSRECGRAVVDLAKSSNANAIAACEDLLRLQVAK